MMDAIKQHAQACYPRECCGVVIVKRGKKRYIPCRNISPVGSEFAIHPEDYAAAEDAGEVVQIVHSHVNRSPKPSQADIVGCNKSGVEWLIVSVPTMATHTLQPSTEAIPLYGREFTHGVLDCYTFIRDYYQQVLNITLPDFDRSHNWWHGDEDLYVDNFEKAGFYVVDDLQTHDVILMQYASNKLNHGAVYLGNNQIGQHVMHRLSSRDVYGGWYQKISRLILRHL